MNSLEEYFSAIEAREKACVDLTASAGDIPNLVKLVRKYREALDVACVASCSCMTKSGDYELHAETCRYKQLRTALAYNPREEGKK